MNSGQPQTIARIDNFWGGEDDDEVNPEYHEYYKNLLEQAEKFTASIIGYDFLKENGKQYTAYKIHVTINYEEYAIHKRFSKFENLRDLLKDNYPDLNFKQIPFPEKSFFSFWKPDVVEKIVKRQKGLNDFLQYVLQNCKMYGIFELLEFLQVREKLKAMGSHTSSHLSMDKSYATNSQEIARMAQYLDQLNNNPDDISKTLKEMEHFYISSRPRLSPDVCKTLLVGKIVQGKLKSQGLIHFCGRYSAETNSHLICVIGLEFLAALMDHQKCQDADHFISVFGNLSREMIEHLNLTAHTEEKVKTNCKSHAFALVDAYLSRNPKLSAGAILKSQSALQQFDLWKRRNKTSSLVAERYQVSGKLNDMEEVADFSLSPQNHVVDQLVDFPSDPEKLISISKEEWVPLYKEEDIKIKYYKSKALSITVRSLGDMESCIRELARGVDYRMLCDESKKVKELDIDIFIQLVKVKFDQPPFRYLVFLNERKIEDNMGEDATILEKPSKDYAIMLTDSELLVKRFTSIVVKYDNKSKGKKKKIKLQILNQDQGSRGLQDFLLKDSGKLIIEGCKKLLEDITR